MVGPVKDVGVSVMPRPPKKLNSEDVKWHIEKTVSQSDCKWLTPSWQLHAVDDHVGSVVKARI